MEIIWPTHGRYRLEEPTNRQHSSLDAQNAITPLGSTAKPLNLFLWLIPLDNRVFSWEDALFPQASVTLSYRFVCKG